MFTPWVGKISWRREWQPSPLFLPGKSHGQRSLVGYSPWGHKESDTTEQLSMHVHTHTHTHIHVLDDYRYYKEKGSRWKEKRKGGVCMLIFTHVQARPAKKVILEQRASS